VDSYTPSLASLRVAVDSELHRFLADRRGAVPDAAPLIFEIERLIDAGGKRLRPAFCYWGYRAAGGEHDRPILEAASSLELLHTFAIVHDDMMDRSLLRRGEPTTHAKFGFDFALLVGDLALVLADALFLSTDVDRNLVAHAFEAYSRMRQEVIAGQYLDLAARDHEVDAAHARRVAILKSALYSVAEPLIIGATLAGANEDLLGQLRAFGVPLGEAFQLRDDILGTFGAPDELGKPVDSDIREGKRHLLYALTIERLEGRLRETFLRLWGGGDALTEEEIFSLRALIDRSGAHAATEAALEERVAEAEAALTAMSLPEDARAALTDLGIAAVERSG
jgi:geranylgeranyl diphosphate synthase, type I